MSHILDRKAAHMASITAPSPSEWGPPLWHMLHWLAEHVGNQKSIILIHDEITGWKKLLQLLKVVLPCTACKGHYTQYFNAHFNLDLIAEMPNGSERRDLIRRWIWELHEAVNVRKEYPVGAVPFESLTEKYLTVDFATERDTFYRILTRALQQNIVMRENVIQFRNIITMFYGMYREFPWIRR